MKYKITKEKERNLYYLKDGSIISVKDVKVVKKIPAHGVDETLYFKNGKVYYCSGLIMKEVDLVTVEEKKSEKKISKIGNIKEKGDK